jgi:soluble lytic murein transglycosylase-like protein
MRLAPFLLLCAPLLAPARPKPPFQLRQSRSIEEILALGAVRYGISPSLVLDIAWRESRYQPRAVNRRTGAAGLLGLMPASAKILGVSDPLDPEQNAEGCIRFLASLLADYDETTALCLYGKPWRECR